MDGTVTCPYCGEEIRAAATRCRFCRSLLVSMDPARWHRDHPTRRLAGVASAVAHGLALPIGVVQLGFLVFTFLHFLGPMLYLALWLLIPFGPGDEPLFARGLAKAQQIFAQARHGAAKAARDRESGRMPTNGSGNAGSAGVPEGLLP